ncbi:hypothetical protein GCM10028826_01290 [Mucilaginibacter boryungensis]
MLTFNNIKEKFSAELAKKILLYGLPICVWFFASQFYTVGDRVLFKYFNVVQYVGNYASFRDLAVGLSGFLTMPLLLASHPIIITMWKNGDEKYKIEQLIEQNIRILILFFFVSFVLTILSGKWIMTTIVSVKYLLNTTLMCLVLLSIFIGTISMYIHKALEVTGKTLLMSKISICVAILSFVLNFVILPLYGVTGAVIVNLVCQVTYLIAVYYYSKSILKPKLKIKFIASVLLCVTVIFTIDLLLRKTLKNHYTNLYEFVYTCIMCLIFLSRSQDIKLLFAPLFKKRPLSNTDNI